MQNKGGLIIIFIVLSVVLFIMFSVDKWSSNNSKMGFGTTGSGSAGAELYTGAVSELKGRNSYADFSVSEEIDVQGAVVLEQTDVEKVTQRLVSRTSFAKLKTQNQNKTENLGIASNDWLEQRNNPASDFNTVLKTRTTDVKSIAADPTKAKTESKATDPKNKTGKMKLPGEPIGEGLSLPIGDGTWMMLMMLGVYGVKKLVEIYPARWKLIRLNIF